MNYIRKFYLSRAPPKYVEDWDSLGFYNWFVEIKKKEKNMKSLVSVVFGFCLLAQIATVAADQKFYIGAGCQYLESSDSPSRSAFTFKNNSGSTQDVVCPMVRDAEDHNYGGIDAMYVYTNDKVIDATLQWQDFTTNDGDEVRYTDFVDNLSTGTRKFSWTVPTDIYLFDYLSLILTMQNGGKVYSYSIYDL